MATKLEVYQEVAVRLGSHRIETVTDNVELVHVLDDLYSGAVDYVLTLVPWRFAVQEQGVAEDGGAPGLNGFDTGYSLPANLLRMVGAFVIGGATARYGELPVDIRMDNGYLYSNLDGENIKVYYISTGGRTESGWSTGYTQTLCDYLAWKASQRISQLNGRSDTLAETFQTTLGAQAQRFAVSESPWLSYQLDGSFIRAAHYILAQGPWRFALENVSLSANMSGGISSFAYNFDVPADHVLTYAIWEANALGRRMPIDARETREGYSAHIDEIEVEYVTNAVLHTPQTWPEAFLRCVGAHLGINFGDTPVTRSRDGEAQEVVWPQYLQRALELEGAPPNPWLPHQLGGSFLRAARFVMMQGMWRFALKSSARTPSAATPLNGFDYGFDLPNDHLKTHAIYKTRADGREVPVDVREHEQSLSAHESAITIRYLSSAYLYTPAEWPDPFLRCVTSYLGINLGDLPAVVRGEDGRASAQPTIWPEYIQQAAGELGIAADRWLPLQLNGQFARAVETIGQMKFWRFALKNETRTADGSTTQAAPGYDESFAIPSTHVRTRSISALTGSDEHPVDAREVGGYWMANVSSIAVQYLDSALLYDADLWPAEWLDLVWHYAMGTEGWDRFLAKTAGNLAVRESPWLPHQLDGSFITGVRYLTSQQDWKWATTTTSLGTASTTGLVGAWTYRYDLPAGWAVTSRVFWIDTAGDPHDIAWQEDASSLFTNHGENVHVDYLNATQIADVTAWPEYFDAALLAYLNFRAASADPSTPGAVLESRRRAYEELKKNAKTRDDHRRRPRVVREPGRFVAARRFSSWSEQG